MWCEVAKLSERHPTASKEPAAARARADDLLSAFDLTEAADRQVKKYSGGMRRRLDIAASIVVAPDIPCLDKAPTGLDPPGRREV